MYMRIHDIIWVAGFFDGEGNITLTKSSKPNASGNPSYVLVVAIAQRDEGLLRELQEAWGGYVSLNPLALQMSGENAGRFLRAVLPYLRTRRKHQAQAAIEYREHLKPRVKLTKEDVALRERFRRLINIGMWSQKRTHQLSGGE